MEDTHPSQEIFIIRLWRKLPKELAWRGQAQNVRTGQQVVIHSLSDLETYFETYFPKEETTPDMRKSGLK